MFNRIFLRMAENFDPPDIRRFYKLHRKAVHLFVRGASKLKDGHTDLRISSPDGYIPVRLYPPADTLKSQRLIIFFHGGGWVIDDIDRYHKVVRQLARLTGSFVISVGYRLAPENKYPAALNDCYNAARAIFKKAPLYGISPNDIILAGDSAGGNLAAAVSLKARDERTFKVRRQLLIYPCTACEFEDDSPFASMRENGRGRILTAERLREYLELYLSDSSQKNDPYVSPYKAADHTRLPETLIITAENDPLRDEGLAYGKRLHGAGVNVMAFCIKDAYHGFFATDLFLNPHARKAVSMIMYFLRLTD